MKGMGKCKTRYLITGYLALRLATTDMHLPIPFILRSGLLRRVAPCGCRAPSVTQHTTTSCKTVMLVLMVSLLNRLMFHDRRPCWYSLKIDRFDVHVLRAVSGPTACRGVAPVFFFFFHTLLLSSVWPKPWSQMSSLPPGSRLQLYRA